MMVLKAGAISTLDIIAGIKQKVIDVKDLLPDALKIGFIGDQSLFVRGAITGVANEGVIAALLTSVMILLFLGSWRSTVIIAVSIPLSVLGAIIMLSAIGETLNIMTLGGLALAVGILVDDATVTIENINYHLEQGKEVETVDPGRRQPDRDAGLRLAALHLHRVRADVLPARRRALPVRADGGSGDVRDDLVVHPVAHAGADDGEVSAAAACAITRAGRRRRAIRWSGSSAASRRGSSAFARGYRDLLSMALATAPVFVTGFLGFVAVSFLLVPFLGRNFFPVGRCRQHPDACPHPGRHPRRGDRQPVRRRAEGDPQDHPARRDRDAGRQYRHADLRHQHDLQQHRRDRPAGRRHPDQAEGRPPADRGIRPGAARAAAAAVSRHELRVPAGRHRQPDPEFRRAGADRPADPRRQSGGQFRLCQQAAQAGSAEFPASPTRASSNRRTIRPSTSMSTAPARNMSG